MLDLNTNSWINGVPFRQVIENETSVASAVAGVRAKAKPMLDKLDIGEPVDIAALIADGALNTDMGKLRFGRPGGGMTAPGQDYELMLSIIEDGVDPPKCAALGEDYVSGFALTLTVNGKAREVCYTAVPQSRGCPRGYWLYAVATQYDSLVSLAPDLTPGMVAIVSVY